MRSGLFRDKGVRVLGFRAGLEFRAVCLGVKLRFEKDTCCENLCS